MKKIWAPGVMSVIFSIGYVAAVWGKWPLFTYGNGVSAIDWYGHVGTAAAIALILSAFVKEPRSSRLWGILLGAIPYLAMALLFVHELRWFR
jgi:hypothetical protein